MSCPSCAATNPDDARFCMRCGDALVAEPRRDEERKVVTVLFCDLVGSTALSGVLDPEPLRAILLRYYGLMEDEITAHGGIVEKFIGDAVMAVFGLTVIREDDARRALSATVGMQSALARLNQSLAVDHAVRLQIRIGVHSGEVVTTADASTRQALISGEVVNIAARLEQAAGPGEVILSAATARAAGPDLVLESRGHLALKGLAEPFEALRLIDVPSADHLTMRRFDVPFVGRQREIAAMDLAWRQVVEQGRAHVLTLLGEAGIGKTRLVTEWLRRHDGEVGVAGVGRCQSAGTGGSLHALAESVAPMVTAIEGPGVDADGPLGLALTLLHNGLLLDGTPSPSIEETTAAVAHVLHTLSCERPLLVVLDDCHWGEPVLLGMVDRLADELDRMPMMFVCAARPELLDDIPTWGAGRANATTVTVGGLGADDSEILAANLIEVAAHSGDQTRRVVAQAAGNPLYLEQLAAMLDDEGDAGRHLPPTLQALVAARIDRLADDERSTLRCASVLNGQFGVADLHQIAGQAAPGSGYAPVMRSLVRRQFIEPLRRPFGEEPAYRFANTIAQRVAYDGLTKRRRADLHERCGDHLAATRAPDSVVGGHYEKACRYRAEVGPSDGSDRQLRQRAVRYLLRAGTSAVRRVDLPRAKALLRRAVSLTDGADDPFRAQGLEQLGEVELMLGRVDDARVTLRNAVTAADAAGLASTGMHARLHLAVSGGDAVALESIAERARPVFAAATDDLGTARCDLILAASRQRRGQHARALAILDRALVHSLAAGADRELANVLGAVGTSLWHGPEPVGPAVSRCQDLLSRYGGSRRPVQATLGFAVTVLYAIGGRPDRATEWLERTDEAMSALSYVEGSVFRPLLAGLVASTGGDQDAAGGNFRDALDRARGIGAAGLGRLVSYRLARVHLATGRWQNALDLVGGVDTAAEDPAGRADRLGISARCTVRSGHHPEAVAAAREAVRLAEGTDSPADRACAYLDLADVLARTGSPGPARAASAQARRLYTAKGHLVGMAAATGLWQALGTSDTPDDGDATGDRHPRVGRDEPDSHPEAPAP